MKKVDALTWQEKANNFQKRILSNPYTKNLDHYRSIINQMHLGKSVLDVGCGERYIKEVLPEGVEYFGIDPIPRYPDVLRVSAEGLNETNIKADTVIMLAALDNVIDVEKALKGLRKAANVNIVILTGLGIKPDQYHTHQIDRWDMVDVLGVPYKETMVMPKVGLFEWLV